MNSQTVRARVCFASGDRTRLLIGSHDIDALVTGALQHRSDIQPATGDWVQARLVDAQLALIESIEPRRSKISRRAAGKRSDEQILAANVDLALLIAGLDGDFNPRRLERYLALCYEGGVEPLIVLNKVDEYDAQQALAQIPGRVLFLSARTGEGCEQIEPLLGPGVTAVLLGSSGAGKSTLLNRLMGRDLQATQPVREHDSRGRHTTSHRELFLLPTGAAIIDTPGLREIQLWASEEAIEAVFDEIATLARECRFPDCRHTSEPGCAVRGNVEEDRLASFYKLTREAARVAGESTEKKKWRTVHKAMRQYYKHKGRGWT